MYADKPRLGMLGSGSEVSGDVRLDRSDGAMAHTLLRAFLALALGGLAGGSLLLRHGGGLLLLWVKRLRVATTY